MNAHHQTPPARQQRGKTRDLILKTARTLFNERGEANVTLAHIAEHLGISEGNVWYYFHSKRDMILTLFVELEARVERNLTGDLTKIDQMQQFEDILAQSFHDMWDYRFLYRDHVNWSMDQPALNERLAVLTQRGHCAVESLLERMVQLHLLHMKEGDRSQLATNVWIVTRYWLDHCQERAAHHQITQAEMSEGIAQVYALVQPYLLA